MKKKLITLLLALGLSCACVGLASCGDKDDTSSNDDTTTQQPDEGATGDEGSDDGDNATDDNTQTPDDGATGDDDTDDGDNATDDNTQTPDDGATGDDDTDDDENAPVPQELAYTLIDGGTAYAVSGVGSYRDTDIVIPATYNELPVTAIQKNAFYGEVLTSIEIPNGVTEIGDEAFYRCDQLAEVTIPDSVEEIGSFAFAYCSSLTSATIGDGVKTVGAYAFNSCVNLSGVSLPDGVTTIGNEAFNGCERLASVRIPETISSVGSGAFNGCTNLAYAIYENGKYLGNDVNGYTLLVEATSTSIDSCTVHSDTLVVIDNGLSWLTELSSVTIGDSVKTVGKNAFRGCSKLSNVTLGSGVQALGGYAFSNCSSALKVYYTGTVDGWATIDFDGAYANPMSVATVYINNAEITEVKLTTATYISDYAFYKATKLTSVLLSDSVQSIGASAFASCTNLTEVYYAGTEKAWAEVVVDASALEGKTTYYYSEEEPTESGNYWHYEGGVVTKWA